MKSVLSCPFLEERDVDFYAYKIPVFILLVANTFFLFWIMLVRNYVSIHLLFFLNIKTGAYMS